MQTSPLKPARRTRCPQSNLLTLLCCLLLGLAGCHATSLDPRPAELGQAATVEKLLRVIDQPGPVEFTRHLAANWSVDRDGLINLNHPKAQAAGLEPGAEAIQLYVYSLRHPQFGTFLVDSGVSEKLLAATDANPLGWIVQQAIDTKTLQIKKSTASLVAELDEPVAGVFLTHIHLDHIMGLVDLQPGTPVYLGPGDASLRAFEHLATQGTSDRLLANAGHLRTWQFATNLLPAATSQLADAALIDIFGDASVWAISVPGHTPGATAYLVRATDGVHLLTGDASHTAWGWRHGVEPGSFSVDQPGSAKSLQLLLQLAADHPTVQVQPGHQSL